MRTLSVLLSFFFCAACQCSPFVDTLRFACTTDTDCGDGFVCRDVGGGLECVRPDGGASDGGASDGGASDGGSSDGGASDGGLPDGGNPPHHLSFLSAPQTVAPNDCSKEVVVEVQDVRNTPAPVTASTRIEFGVEGPDVGFDLFQNPNCSGPPVSAVDLSVGASRGTLYFKGKTEGAYKLHATGSDLGEAGSALISVFRPGVALQRSTHGEKAEGRVEGGVGEG